MKTKAAYFITAGIVLLLLTAVWVGGLIFTVTRLETLASGAKQGLGWTLVLSGLGLLSVWGTWFTVGFRTMGAKDKDL